MSATPSSTSMSTAVAPRGAARARRRWAAALAVALLAAVGLATPAAADPVPTVRVHVRVEGATSTVFEGWVTTSPHDVTSASGGTHPCDGTNDGAYPTPGGTALTALDDAASSAGFTWDGTYDSYFQDYSVDRIGSDTQTPTRFWGLLVNDQFTPGGGCTTQPQDGDEVLWAYDAFNKAYFLKLTGPASVQVGVPFTVTVVDGSTGSPVAGATVGGVQTAADGTATLTEPTPGPVSLKAERSDSVRSNALTYQVGAAPTISGTPPSPVAVGASYAFSYGLTGDPAPTTSASGTLPPGLVLSSAGTISGAPTTAGSYSFTVTADNGVAPAATTTSTILVGTAPTVTGAPPLASVREPYDYTFVGAGSPTPTLTADSLPPGLSLAADGRLTGTPTEAGTYAFTVTATNALGTAGTPVTLTVRGLPGLRVADAARAEGGAGTSPLAFRVTLARASTVPVSVHWATADGSATAPGDYRAASGTLRFAPGQRTATATVAIVGDHVREPNEVFYLLLTTPVNALLADGVAVGGIVDDD